MKSLVRMLLILAGLAFIGACGDDDGGSTTADASVPTPDAKPVDAGTGGTG